MPLFLPNQNGFVNVIIADVAQFCRENPNASIVPKAVSSHGTDYEWKCARGKPVVTYAEPLDERGFRRDMWIAVAGATSTSAADACAALLPAALRMKITHQYNDFVLPKQSDYSDEDIAYNVEHGGSGCLGIATGSYYPPGNVNFALLITSSKLKDTLLIVADGETAGWTLEVVYNWRFDATGEMYVAAANPGTYKRTEAYDGPTTEPGERESYSAQRQGIEVGKIGSGHGVFFFDGTAWVHVWTSD